MRWEVKCVATGALFVLLLATHIQHGNKSLGLKWTSESPSYVPSPM